MKVTDGLRQRLERALAPSALEIEDESARHHGHAGSHAEGETHFRIVVVSTRFVGLGRLARQRLVHEAVAELLATRIHALSIKALTPAEAGLA